VKNIYQNKRKRRKLFSWRWALMALVILLVIVITLFILEKTNVIDLFSKPDTINSSSQPGDSTTNSSSSQQGGAVDMSGTSADAAVETNQAQWIVSASGVITLQQPLTNGVVRPGDAIRGLSSTEVVQYRVEDDAVGVIAQGSLNVVDGQFYGILQFQAHSATGTLDTFTFDPTSGAEINHADINIKFTE
jgi:cytoskeletal protein RodZ